VILLLGRTQANRAASATRSRLGVWQLADPWGVSSAASEGDNSEGLACKFHLILGSHRVKEGRQVPDHEMRSLDASEDALACRIPGRLHAAALQALDALGANRRP